MKRTYDSTVARMAGNIASGWIPAGLLEHGGDVNLDAYAGIAVRLARAIIAEVERTEQPSPEDMLAAAKSGR